MSSSGSTGNGRRNATTCGVTSCGGTRYSRVGSDRSGNQRCWSGSYSGTGTRNGYGGSTSLGGRCGGATTRSGSSGGSRDRRYTRDWSSTGHFLGEDKGFPLLVLKSVTATKDVAGVGRVRPPVEPRQGAEPSSPVARTVDTAHTERKAGRRALGSQGGTAVPAPERKAAAVRPLVPTTPSGAPTATAAPSSVPVVVGRPVAPGAAPRRPSLGPARATVGSVPRVPVVAQTARKATAVTGADGPAATASPPETVLEVAKGGAAATEVGAPVRVRALAPSVRPALPETAVGVAAPTGAVLTPAAVGGPRQEEAVLGAPRNSVQTPILEAIAHAGVDPACARPTPVASGSRLNLTSSIEAS